jgi:hypothetical protein
MFVSWVEASQTAGGFSSIMDVTAMPPALGDNMESFIFAEVFKWVFLHRHLRGRAVLISRYHFLLHSDPDVISLDDYVLNTGECLGVATQYMLWVQFWPHQQHSRYTSKRERATLTSPRSSHLPSLVSGQKVRPRGILVRLACTPRTGDPRRRHRCAKMVTARYPA